MANLIGAVASDFWANSRASPRGVNKNARKLATIMKMVDANLRSRFPLHVVHLPDMSVMTVQTVMSRLESDIQSRFLNDGGQPTPTEKIEKWVEEQTGFAVLSHRWGYDELTFQDVRKISSFSRRGIDQYMAKFQADSLNHQPGSSPTIEAIRRLSGVTSPDELDRLEELKRLREYIPDCRGLIKLINFCELSLQKGCMYAWLDTGCIDKTNSTELSESIRSMFLWYRASKVCIVHLGDTTYGPDLDYDQWFNRGWTLQELLAPKALKFYNSEWKAITTEPNDKGTANETRPLLDKISDLTGISVGELHDFRPGLRNLRERLVWASRRSTTRIEDMAYCLFGVFDINISVLYGEKEHAFFRFQEEMIRKTPDHGMFLWNGVASPHNSFFASSPHDFISLGINLAQFSAKGHSAPYFTAFGFHITLMLQDIQPVLRRDETNAVSYTFQLRPAVSDALLPVVMETPRAKPRLLDPLPTSHPYESRLTMRLSKDGNPRIVIKTKRGRSIVYSKPLPRNTTRTLDNPELHAFGRMSIEPRKDGEFSLALHKEKPPHFGGSSSVAASAADPQKKEPSDWTFIPDIKSSPKENDDPRFKLAILATSSDKRRSLAVLLVGTDANHDRPSYRRVPGSPVFIGDWAPSKSTLEKVTIQ